MKVRSCGRERFEHLADAGDPGPPAVHAERDVGTEPRAPGRGPRRPPTAARRRRRRTRRPARRRRGCACAAGRAPCGRRGAGPGDEVVVVGGHRQARGADDLEAVAVGEGELVGQVERDHLGIDQVVAVVSHAGDAQRHGELGQGRDGDRTRRGDPTQARVRRARGGPRPRRRAYSGRAAGSMPAAANASGSTRPASERRSILRRWPKPVCTRANRRAGAASVAGAARRDDLDQGRLHLRPGQEHLGG